MPELPAIEKHGQLTILRTRGTPYELGFQQGSHLAERIPTGPLPYLKNVIRMLMANSPVPFMTEPMVLWLRWTVSKRLARRFPAEANELMRGFCDGARLSRRDFLEVATLPETLVAMVALSRRVYSQELLLGSLPLGGCTSAIAGRSATSAGRILHGRNLDYPATGYWDRNLLAVLHEPSAGLRYLSVTAAGIPGGGVTGMNEAGITVAIHQHWVRDLDMSGIPVGVASELVLRDARSLDDAVRILLEYPPVGGWSYVMTDGKTGEALVLEVAPGRHGVVRLGETAVPDCMGYSNVFVSRELRGSELTFVPAYWDNCLARHATANQLLRAGHGSHTPQSVADILGHDEEPSCGARRLFGSVIPMAITVASVVFDPEEARAWVSEGPAPASHGRFIPISLRHQGLDPEAQAFTPRGFSSPERAEAYRWYVAAYREFLERQDAASSRDLLREATRLAPDAPELWHLQGLLSLRLVDPHEAMRCFEEALTRFQEPVKVAESRLGIGLALDLAGGNRKKALEVYRDLAGDESLPKGYRSIARMRLRIPFGRVQARYMSIVFVFGGLGG